MPPSSQESVTRLLQELKGGNRAVVDALFSLIYEELHAQAKRQRADRDNGNQGRSDEDGHPDSCSQGSGFQLVAALRFATHAIVDDNRHA